MTDYISIIESPFYEKANKYVEETGNNDCTLEAYIDGATEATKELEAQIEKMKCLLEEWYKQHSDKTYTKTFYDELIKATEAFLWSDVCVK